jgi:hypothetical protein
MNYFSHALPFLDDPYFVAGTAVPDWLGVADRAARVRAKNVEPLIADSNPIAAAVARGLCQHFRDDAVFHRTRAFAEATMELSAAIRRLLDADMGFRPSFLAHLLVEVLLDWTLAEEHPGSLESYYQALEAVDAAAVQEAVNRMATRPTDRLAPLIFLFRRERILWDYGRDDKLLVRMNQVMRRVGFSPLPSGVQELFPAARQLVCRRRHELLEGIPANGFNIPSKTDPTAASIMPPDRFP